MRFNYLLVACIAFSIASYSQQKRKTENVILITLDGMRWQEIFGGAEARLITKQYVRDSGAVVRDFWMETPQQRREKLMPFFWTTIAKQGQLYGNRAYNNFVNVSNNQWFSYPGYSEILCGFADNARVHSNDKFDNPNKTVLEFLNNQKEFKGKVAAYTSWDVFPYIINTKRSGVPVSGGQVESKDNPTEKEKCLNELMYQVPNPLGDIRLDAFTFHYALEYLRKHNPRVLYLSLDETDDFAHHGNYDLYLRSAQYTDGFIRTLWNWCQSNEKYKDKTTFIITTDHGRGSVDIDTWRSHGAEVVGSNQIWLAVMGPDTPAMGEMKTQGQLYQNQVAKTLAQFLGIDYQNDIKPGEAISSVFPK
jgi:Type I phosphodiesterase / nucleotide pyrophosphatase